MTYATARISDLPPSASLTSDIAGGTYNVNTLNFSTGPYSLIDSAGTPGSVTLSSITHTGGTNTIGLKLNSPTLAANISGGQLSVTNATNSIAASWPTYTPKPV